MATIWRQVSFLKTFLGRWLWLQGDITDGKAPCSGRYNSQDPEASLFTKQRRRARSIWIKSSYFSFLGNGDSLKATSCFPSDSLYSKKARCLIYPIIGCLGVEMGFFPTWMIDDNKSLGYPQEPLKCIRISIPSSGAQILFPQCLRLFVGSIPGRRACGYPGWWELRAWPLDRGLVGPLLDPLFGAGMGLNDRKAVLLQIWWSWLCLLPHVSLTLPGKGQVILTTLYHAQALHQALDMVSHFISIAATPWGRSYSPILQKRKLRLGKNQ